MNYVGSERKSKAIKLFSKSLSNGVTIVFITSADKMPSVILIALKCQQIIIISAMSTLSDYPQNTWWSSSSKRLNCAACLCNSCRAATGTAYLV